MESNYNGRLSHVSSQPAMIPSSRSLLSRDKRLPLDTWNQIWIAGKCFGNQFLRLIHPEIVIKEIPHSITLGTAGSISVLIGTGDSDARDEDLTRGTIPMPTFARRPSDYVRVLQNRWNYRRTTRSDSKDSEYRICYSTNFLIHHRC